MPNGRGGQHGIWSASAQSGSRTPQRGVPTNASFADAARTKNLRSRIAAGEIPRHSSGNVIASLQVLYEGNVQGVGFRYSVRQIAKGFDITGSVRNLRDGRVELLVVGEADEVRAFLEAIGQSELRAHIKKQSEALLVNPPPIRGFESRHD